MPLPLLIFIFSLFIIIGEQMKSRKHRIFIINKNNINPQVNFPAGQGNVVSQQIRNQSKRKKLFKIITTSNPQGQNKSNSKYAYQLRPHIHAQSLATLIQCDLLGSNKSQMKKQQGKVGKNQKDISTKDRRNTMGANNLQNMEQLAKGNQQNNLSLMNTLRKRIFDNINIQQFRPRSCYSSLSTSKRKNIFFRYTSPNDLSINSLSKQRRRIFSQNTNILPFVVPNSKQHIGPLQSTIKEQQQKDISKITQVLGQSKKGGQSLHRQY